MVVAVAGSDVANVDSLNSKWLLIKNRTEIKTVQPTKTDENCPHAIYLQSNW